jgi:uncharacterized protein YyaL (SSP411 family)
LHDILSKLNNILENKKPNRLKEALSPYLLQHAFNPVDWYEWGPEALEKAERENKLLLLSIGYSACHWCHVMAHESFEDNATAEIMNSLFVCVKVDREELPDLDMICMDACQLINGSGGWPLNAFLLPDKRPLHALTYAPNSQWKNILLSLNNLWVNEPSKAYEYAENLAHGVSQLSLPPLIRNDSKAIENLSKKAFEIFKQHYDPQYGGMNRAPKFPMPVNYNFLLDYALVYDSTESLSMALKGLKHMALGGINDAVEGGFSRYSVDERWFAPHFEKMLYDNAQLISQYALAYAAEKDEFFKNVCRRTIDFCLKNWQTDDGLFISAFDADSEGFEGHYYTYLYEELELLLGTDTPLFAKYYSCIQEGNWEHDRNILYAEKTIEEFALTEKLNPDVVKSIIGNCLQKLLENRQTRIAPAADDKCICSWNMLMVKGLAEAAALLGDDKLVLKATETMDKALAQFFSHTHLYRIRKGEVLKTSAFLEDYATCIEALLYVYKVSGSETYLLKAESLCNYTVLHFFDKEKGFFRFSEADSGIGNKYETGDDVISSSNSIMAHNLYTLYWYFDRNDWFEIAETMCLAMQELSTQSSPWYANWARLSLRLEHPCTQYIHSTDSETEYMKFIHAHSKEPYALFGRASAHTEVPLLKGKEFSGKSLVYTCVDKTCYLPAEI